MPLTDEQKEAMRWAADVADMCGCDEVQRHKWIESAALIRGLKDKGLLVSKDLLNEAMYQG